MLESQEDFEVAYRTYEGKIYRFLLWRTRDRELSEDLTSVVFEKAWRARSRFDGTSMQAWLYSIARNTLTDHWRKKKEVASDSLDDVPDERISSGEALDQEQAAQELRRAVSKLPEQMRQVVTHRFLEGKSARQTGDTLGISEANVRVIQYRALKRLRKDMS